MRWQLHHPPIVPVPGRPMPLWPAPRPIPQLSGVFGRGSQQQEFIQLPPPPGLPATKKPKEYVTIHPGSSMLLTHAKAFLENFFLPHQKKSKGGGHNGQLMYGCHRPGCTLLCRLVPIPDSDPPLYKAEVKRLYSGHTNHNALYRTRRRCILASCPSRMKSSFTSISSLKPNLRQHQA
jgi:hypothetical protein